MNAISKVSAFPATVQPGIPALPAPPVGWSQEPLGRYLEEVRRPVALCDGDYYELVTAKRARGGIVPRERLKGSDISVKSQFRLKEGDFLISKRQIVHGACGFVPRDLEGAIVSNEYAVLRCRAGLDPLFLSYLTHTIHFQQTCFHSSIGVHIEKMIFKLERWLKWKFNLPPLSEQKKIADILAAWDEAIVAADKMLANAEAQNRSLMQQLLTANLRLPGLEHRSWSSVRLSEATTFIKDGTHGTHKRYVSGVPMLSAANITEDGCINFSDASLISVEDYQVIHKRYEISPGDVLVTIVGTLGRSALVDCSRQFTVQRSVAILRSANNVLPEFLAHVVQTSDFQRQLKLRANVTAQAGVYLGELAKISIPLPGLDEQRAIISILEASSTLVRKSRAKIGYLQNEKSALLQQLLTGKRRVTA